LAAIGAELQSGFDVVADEVGLYERIEGADLVITGEGFLDSESFDGKVVGGICDLAREAEVPVLAVVGEAFDDVDQRVETISLVERFGHDRSMADPVACIEEAVADWLTKVSGDGRPLGRRSPDHDDEEESLGDPECQMDDPADQRRHRRSRGG
jgi:glycerate kinase